MIKELDAELREELIAEGVTPPERLEYNGPLEAMTETGQLGPLGPVLLYMCLGGERKLVAERVEKMGLTNSASTYAYFLWVAAKMAAEVLVNDMED